MKIIKEFIPYVIIIIVVVLIRTFVITPVMVDGTSMKPTLINKQILLLKKYDHSFKRYDIIVFNFNAESLVKRVIGLPGEHVKIIDNKVYINNKEIKDVVDIKMYDFDLQELDFSVIPSDHYFVLGDNRSNSVDSRSIGLISKNDIKGSTSFSLWPLNRFGTFK